MVRPFDDATRRNIAELCAAFTRPPDEAQSALKRAAVAIALTGRDRPTSTAFLLTRARREPARASRPMGAAGRALRRRRDAGRRPRCANSTRSSASGSRRATCSACSTIIRPAPAISSRPWWSGSATAPRSAPNPAEVASVHRVGLDDIERDDAFSFTDHPREHAAGDPLPPCRPAYPCADGGADLSVPRGAGRPRDPRRRTGTAGVRLEVARGRELGVIARSEATKQSILSACGEMDCFASLAMMLWTAPPKRHRVPKRGRRSATKREAVQ